MSSFQMRYRNSNKKMQRFQMLGKFGTLILTQKRLQNTKKSSRRVKGIMICVLQKLTRLLFPDVLYIYIIYHHVTSRKVFENRG